MEAAKVNPFNVEGLTDVYLPHAPLLRALVQVRFPGLVRMQGSHLESTISEIADRLGGEYPLLVQAQEMQFLFGPEGVSQQPAGKLWELRNAENTWRVTLAPTFASLETSRYTKRGELADRFSSVVGAIADVVSPPFAERVGVRYTNRVDNAELLERLPELVRAEALGGGAVAPEAGLLHTLNEALYDRDGSLLHARWGILPAGASLEPSLPPNPQRAWFLDLDSFMQNTVDFQTERISELVKSLSVSAYSYFRWVVTDKFLREFGGEV